MKNIPWIILIILLGALLRFFMLGSIPAGVSDDELTFIYNAYSIAKTGRNVVGDFLPFITWMNPYSTPILPGQVYIIAPLFLLFDLSSIVGRLPSATLGVADIFLLYLLIKRLFKNQSLALLSAAFLAISPWHIHFSRIAYDTNIAAFFILLGIVLFLHETDKKRLPIFSVFSFFIAAYTYRAANLLLLPFFISLLWYGKKAIKLSRRQLTFSIVGFLTILLSLVLVVFLNGSKYISEAGRFYGESNGAELLSQVEEFKGPVFIRRIFINKVTYSIYKIRENYTNVFSPSFLFLHTESEKIYSIWSRGRIYYIDALFIILGLIFLFRINKRSMFFLTALLLSSAIPGAFSGPPYSARDYFMSIILPVFSAGGVLFIVSLIKNKNGKKFIVALITLSYIYLLSSYLFDYYGRYAIYSSESWFKSAKEVSNLINSEKNNYDKVIVGASSLQELIQYSFYSKMNPDILQKTYKKREGNVYKIQNIIFTPECFEGEPGKAPEFRDYKRVLYVVPDRCAVQISPNKVVKDYLGNTVWKIYYLTPSSR